MQESIVFFLSLLKFDCSVWAITYFGCYVFLEEEERMITKQLFFHQMTLLSALYKFNPKQSFGWD